MLDFYKQAYPIARKSHECEFCHKEIHKGERYSCETGKYDGDMFTRKLCPECYHILIEFCREEGWEDFDLDMVDDWLSDKYCYDCPNRNGCDIVTYQCGTVRAQYGNSFTEDEITI